MELLVDHMGRCAKVRALSVLMTLVVALLIASGPALGDTFTVTNTNDSGRGSLRAAITEAKENTGKDIVNFAPSVSGEIRLRSALPTLTGELEVRGPGAGKLTVRRAAQSAFRIFTIEEGSTVKISGLTISNGLADGPEEFFEEDYGGGVYNDGDLTLKGVVVSSNKAGFSGGGVFNNDDGDALTVENSIFSENRARVDAGGAIDNGGTLTVRNSTFKGNSAYRGGAIANFEAATVEGSALSGNRAQIGAAILTGGPYPEDDHPLKVTDSTFTGNTAARNGGAIYLNRFGPVTVERSTFTGNSSSSGMGGAILGYRGSVKVTDSTFAENTAGTDGGAIVAYRGGTLVILGSTFLANSAAQGGAVSSYRNTTTISNSTFARNTASSGGGLYHIGDSPEVLSLSSVTFANNEATGSGGGVYAEPRVEEVAAARLRATILSGNEAPEGPDAFGTFDSRGYNLIGDTSGATGFGATDLTNTGAGLDPDGLQDNGGPTKTFALTQSSPALDAVEEGCPPPSTDQRGVSRPQNGDGEGEALCDIGAYERRAPSQ
jgi:predicted outer membrane repeat protein